MFPLGIAQDTAGKTVHGKATQTARRELRAQAPVNAAKITANRPRNDTPLSKPSLAQINI
jgi:hypothetical protein